MYNIVPETKYILKSLSETHLESKDRELRIMKQEFIEKYYLGKEVEIDIGGNTTYRGIAAECNDGVLSLKWTIKEEGYTHIEIEKIAAMWRTLK